MAQRSYGARYWLPVSLTRYGRWRAKYSEKHWDEGLQRGTTFSTRPWSQRNSFIHYSYIDGIGDARATSMSRSRSAFTLSCRPPTIPCTSPPT